MLSASLDARWEDKKMDGIKNSDVVRHVLKSLFAVSGRRDSQLFAVMAMDSIVQTLAQKYNFLKYVKIEIKEGVMLDSQNIVIDVPHDLIDVIEPHLIGEAIESIIRVVMMDLGAKAGLFFITEFKKKMGPDYMPVLRKLGVNLGNMQLEQRFLYARIEKNKSIIRSPSASAEHREKVELTEQDSAESLFGYEWGKVSSYKYNSDTMEYVIYDKNGGELDRLDLDAVVSKLTGLIELDAKGFDASSTKDDQHKIQGDFSPGSAATVEDDESEEDKDEKIDITKKEYQFLEMLFEQDMDADTAIHLLEITMNDLDFMVKRLLKFEILKSNSDDEVELTEFGINYMMSLYGA